MSIVHRCVRCDRRMDPYGRDGAMCEPCLEEHLAAYEQRRTEALKAKIARAA